MDLNKLIPDKFKHLSNWSVDKGFLFFRKIDKLPVLKIEDDIVYVFLDLRIRKEMIVLIEHLEKLGVEFYFTHPDFSNPGEEWNEREVIFHYYRCWFDDKFHKACKKIDFDFIKNLTNWVNEFSSFELLKSTHDEFSKKVVSKWYDYYANKDIWVYSEEMREEFRKLWREIQINNIL